SSRNPPSAPCPCRLAPDGSPRRCRKPRSSRGSSGPPIVVAERLSFDEGRQYLEESRRASMGLAMTYTPPLRDLAFALDHVAGVGALRPLFPGYDAETEAAVLEA